MIPPQVWLAEDSGAHPTEAALLISYFSIGSSIGRLIFGRTADCKTFNRFYVWQTGLLGVKRVINTGHHGQCLQMASGVCNNVWTVRGLLRVRKSRAHQGHCWPGEICPRPNGLAFFTMSLTKSIGPPIAGWIYDKFHGYYAAFMYTGLVFLLANCIAFVVSVPMQEKSNITKLGGKSKSLPFVYVDRETDV